MEKYVLTDRSLELPVRRITTSLFQTAERSSTPLCKSTEKSSAICFPYSIDILVRACLPLGSPCILTGYNYVFHLYWFSRHEFDYYGILLLFFFVIHKVFFLHLRKHKYNIVTQYWNKTLYGLEK